MGVSRMNEIITQYIKPELLLLVPVAYVSGVAFKQSKVMKDEYIPFLLGFICIVLSTLYLFATTDITSAKDVALLIFCGLTQGVLCAGGSVYFNQLQVQAKKNK